MRDISAVDSQAQPSLNMTNKVIVIQEHTSSQIVISTEGFDSKIEADRSQVSV